MKIAPPPPRQPRQARLDDPPTEKGRRIAPVVLDEMGCARLVLMMPTTDAAWIVLTDRLPANGAYLAARLTATSDRVNDAVAAVAKALVLCGERHRTNPPVPQAWVDKLAELAVEEVEATWSLDDAAHAAAVEPAWVETGARPVPADECSWLRVSRLIARVLQAVNGLEPPEEVWERVGSMRVEQEVAAGDVERIKQRCRSTVRWAVGATFGTTKAGE